MLQKVQKEGQTLQKMSQAMISASPLSEIFSTQRMSVSLNEQSELFRIHLFDDSFDLKFCELTRFKYKIEQVDVVGMLSGSVADIEVIYLTKPDRLLMLTIHEILELRDLFSGTFTMLSLNSLIHQEVVRKSLLIA